MSKTYKILFGVLVALLVVLTYLEAKEQGDLNWIPSYTSTDKIPLGAMVLFENLNYLDKNLHKVQIPPYEFLKDSVPTGTYFFLNDALHFHDSELDRLLAWIAQGNSAFLIAEQFSENILDTLHLQMNLSAPEDGIFSKPLLHLSDPELKTRDSFLFSRETYQYTFRDLDSLQHRILGYSRLFTDSLSITDPEPNFLVDTIGKGRIYLHSTPRAFSNFFLLQQDNHKYAEYALAYLPRNEKIYWDAHYKSGKAYQSSPLFVLLNKKALKWAYYFTIIGSLLFLIFEGKRKQRIVPVMAPLQNQSYHFARTIAGLFLKRQDYKGIASKKTALFLDHVRRRYRISTADITKKDYARLAGLNGSSPAAIQDLWEYMNLLEKKQDIAKDELLLLNKKINAFKNRKHGT